MKVLARILLMARCFNVLYRRMETIGISKVGWMDFCTFVCLQVAISRTVLLLARLGLSFHHPRHKHLMTVDQMASAMKPSSCLESHEDGRLTRVHFHTILCGDSNDTARRPRSRVTCLLAFLIAALAKVISAGVDNNGSL